MAFKLKTKIVYIITFILILSDNKQTGIQLLCPGPLYLLKYYICVRIDQYIIMYRLLHGDCLAWTLHNKNRTFYYDNEILLLEEFKREFTF